MSFHVAKDRVVSTLASIQLVGDNHLHVATGDGDLLFPSTFPFYITVENEREECTARTTDTLTTTRGVANSSAAEHASGKMVSLNVLAENITELQGETVIKVYASDALNKPSATVTGIYYVCDGTADQDDINPAVVLV